MHIKKFLNRRTIAAALYYSGLLFMIGYMKKYLHMKSPLYLTGHRVLPAGHAHISDIDNMALISGHAITDHELARRLRFVMRYRAVGNPVDLARGMPSGDAFYLTFDDGYLDNLRVAGPQLKKLGIKAVIFIVGELLRNPKLLPWWDAWGSPKYNKQISQNSPHYYMQLCRNMIATSRGLLRDGPEAYTSVDNINRLYMSEHDARQAFSEGTFYPASHTLSHANLTLLSESEIAEEINGGIEAVRNLPNYLPLLAYPFGFFNKKVLSYLKSRNDISLAFATRWGTAGNQFALKRVNLNTAPFCLFAAECIGVFDFANKAQ
jgi:peptidoglycan/xylan/chitin deacetylase (PgdA/CDA1 family)